MDNAGYVALTRQSGLMAELRVVANNIANASTTGFRAETVSYAEHIDALGAAPSLSMADIAVRGLSEAAGGMTQTGGAFDLAIEGDGYFMIQTPAGERLTRNGAFTPNENGDLVTLTGEPVLDAGGSPLFVPTGAGPVAIAPDGTISAGGQPVGQIGIFMPSNPLGLLREDGVRFAAPDGAEPMPDGRLVQGFLEGSNVNPIAEVARMIEVQRAYELGQGFLDKEDERIRAALSALGQRG